MSNDHVSIPRFIQRQFAAKGLVANYNIHQHKLCYKSIKTLGTIPNYYTKDVEAKILGVIESDFANVVTELLQSKNSDDVVNIFNNKHSEILDFLNIQYFRSPASLKDVNNHSLSAAIYGPFSPSALIKIANKRNISILSLVGDDPKIYPVINRTQRPFINNSIGFGFIFEKNKNIAIFYPISPKFGIYLCNNKELDYPFYRIDDSIVLDKFNNFICDTEAGFGLGYIFTIDGINLLPYLSRFEKTFAENPKN